MADNIVGGSRIRGRLRPPATYALGRVCLSEECDTLLSRYNKGKLCHLHAPRSFPRLRGRTAH